MFLKYFLILFSLFTIVFFSCKKYTNFSSNISFVHAGLGMAPFTLKADSNVLLNNVKYDSVFYQSAFASGTYSLSFATSAIAFTPIITNLEAGASYIGFLYDTVNTPKLYFTKDMIPTVPSEGRCKVRFFNLIKGSPALTVANDTFRTYASAGEYDRYFNAFTEIDTIPRPSVRIDSLTYITRLPTLRSGKIYTFYLTGRIGDTLSGIYKPRVIVQLNN